MQIHQFEGVIIGADRNPAPFPDFLMQSRCLLHQRRGWPSVLFHILITSSLRRAADEAVQVAMLASCSNPDDASSLEKGFENG